MWDEKYKGKVQGRPHSLLLGIGLWMGPRPAEPFRFAEMRTQYAEKFKAA